MGLPPVGGHRKWQKRNRQHEGRHAQEHNSIFLAFENFGDETLDYDPTLGISPLSTGATWTFLGIDYNQLVLVAGGASVVALIVIATKFRNNGK